jgi:hypothetical protein
MKYEGREKKTGEKVKTHTYAPKGTYRKEQRPMQVDQKGDYSGRTHGNGTKPRRFQLQELATWKEPLHKRFDRIDLGYHCRITPDQARREREEDPKERESRAREDRPGEKVRERETRDR